MTLKQRRISCRHRMERASGCTVNTILYLFRTPTKMKMTSKEREREREREDDIIRFSHNEIQFFYGLTLPKGRQNILKSLQPFWHIVWGGKILTWREFLTQHSVCRDRQNVMIFLLAKICSSFLLCDHAFRSNPDIRTLPACLEITI